MTHQHDWIWVYGLGDGVAAKCPCGIHLSPEEVRCRLNATERLSAEDARTISLWMGGPDTGFIRRGGNKLQAYAAALKKE